MGRSSRPATLAPLLLLLGWTPGCGPSGVQGSVSETPGEPQVAPAPIPGRPPGVGFVTTPAGDVSLRDGGLVVDREDLRIDTRLGPIRVGETFSSATARWHDWLDLVYTGDVLLGGRGTWLDPDRLEGTPWQRVDRRTLRTRGGRLYRFEEGRLTTIEAPFPEAARIRVDRDERGRLRRLIQSTPHPPREETVLEVRYDERGVHLGSYGRTVRRRLDSEGRTTAVWDPAATDLELAPTRYGYDPDGRLVRIVDPVGTETVLLYDEDRVAAVRRGAETHSFSYRVRERGRALERYAVVHVGPEGLESESRHGGDGRVRWRRDAEGGVRRADYVGTRPAWIEDPLGNRWTFEYRDGDLSARTDPAGHRETWELAPGGWNPREPDRTPWLRYTDRGGATWVRELDVYGRPIALADPEGRRGTTAFRGTDVWRLGLTTGGALCLERESAHGHPTGIDPNCAGRPFQVVRNAFGLPIRTSDGGTRRFDPSGRLREIRYPGAPTGEPYRSTFTYDASGRLIQARSPYDGRIEIERDGAGRIIGVREKLIADSDPEWEETGDVFLEERLERDRAGGVTSRIRADATRVEMDRDAAGRLVGLRYRSAEGAIGSEVRIRRDRAGRAVRIEDRRGPGPVEIVRDPLGRPRSVLYPHGERLEQRFDPAGRLVRADLLAPGGRPLAGVEWAYSPSGRIRNVRLDGRTLVDVRHEARATVLHFANGVIERREVDPLGRLVRVLLLAADGSPLRDLEIAYWSDEFRPTLRIRGVVDHAGNEPLLVVTYDEGGRLNGWWTTETRTLVWDVLGNLRGREIFGPNGDRRSEGFQYNGVGSRLRSAFLGAVEHDQRGRITRVGGLEIEWEPFDRPRRIGESRLVYSTLGLPLERTVDGTRTLLLFGGLVETDAAGSPRTLEVGDLRVDLSTGTREYGHRDFRQNVAWWTDGSGRLVASRRFGPFGTEAIEGRSGPRRGFAGGEEIGEVVLLGARVYHPALGRFLSPDPRAALANPYPYADGDPVNFFDPDGLSRTEIRQAARARFQLRPLPSAEFEFAQEILIDEAGADPSAPPADVEPGPSSEPAAPALFPETPNTPTIPDVSLPPRFGGCGDGSESGSLAFTGLLIRLLRRLRGGPARAGSRRPGGRR